MLHLGAPRSLAHGPAAATGLTRPRARPLPRQRAARRAAPPTAAAAAATDVAVPAAPAPAAKRAKPSPKLQRAEAAILKALQGVSGRGAGGLDAGRAAALAAAVEALEAAGGVPAPAASPALLGRWRLLFTTRPGSASPIQRAFTGVEAFKVFQDVEGFPDGSPGIARINNVVEFGRAGELKVEAQASTDAAPLPGFTPRRGAGLPFGLLGVSSTAPPAARDVRVDFQFDRAAFSFRGLPFTIPYPVPFRLLGDERKGWVDVTYLSPDGRFRLSRGNKGTLFVLEKYVEPEAALLEAIAARRPDAEVEALALALAGRGERAPARSPRAAGAWRLRWSRQAKTANPLQRALAGRVKTLQVIEGGRLENVVYLAPFTRVRATARCAPQSDARTGVAIERVALEVGGKALPLSGVRPDGDGFVEWIFLGESLRVTRGYKGSLFVHTRE